MVASAKKKEPAASAPTKGKGSRQVFKKVFRVTTTRNNGESTQHLVRAKSVQFARSAVQGKIEVVIASAEDLMNAGANNIELVEA